MQTVVPSAETVAVTSASSAWPGRDDAHHANSIGSHQLTTNAEGSGVQAVGLVGPRTTWPQPLSRPANTPGLPALTLKSNHSALSRPPRNARPLRSVTLPR